MPEESGLIILGKGPATNHCLTDVSLPILMIGCFWEILFSANVNPGKMIMKVNMTVAARV